MSKRDGMLSGGTRYRNRWRRDFAVSVVLHVLLFVLICVGVVGFLWMLVDLARELEVI
jgi:hypothetical protein